MKIELMTKDYRTVETFTKSADAADYVENDAYAQIEHVVITHSEGQSCFTVEQFLEDYRYNVRKARSTY